MGRGVILILVAILLFIGTCLATFGYYKIVTPYGTGDTFIQTWDAHIGANYNQPERKWIVECQDGEAVVGVLDNGDDFTRMWFVWCKFMFPYKPPALGQYPFYPSCHVRNFTTQFTCYTARMHERTVNTFITGFYGKQWNFIFMRLQVDNLLPYKCCKTPKGYYIDYTACYYQPTHDQFWEYYDTPSYFLLYCATGYVMTGLAKKTNPYTHPDAHLEWFQCCRVGFGIIPIQPPPIGAPNITGTDYGNYSYTVAPRTGDPTNLFDITPYNYAREKPATAHSRFAADFQAADVARVDSEVDLHEHI